MNKKIWISAICISLLPIVSYASSVLDGPHIEVVGEASMNVKPEQAIFSVNLQASAKKVDEAKKQVDKRMAQYVAFFQEMGIDSKDISANDMFVYAEYDSSLLSSAKVSGFRANRVLKVKLTQMNQLSVILEKALETELNEIEEIELYVIDPKPYANQVKLDALENAKEQAKLQVEALGGKLGNVYHISSQPTKSAVLTQKVSTPRADSYSKIYSYNVRELYQYKHIQFTDQVSVVFNIER